jgi:hypothetical protein
MMTLTRIMHRHWHAVERDLFALGRTADDIGTPKLTLWQLISIVVAAPHGTAVREAIDGGWTQTDKLLANLGEQQAGVLRLTGRYPRPGVATDESRTHTTVSGLKPYGGIQMDTMTVDELIAKRANVIRMHREAGYR